MISYRVVRSGNMTPEIRAMGSLWVSDRSFAAVVKYVNGKPVEYVGDDYCEPADADLIRNFAWVASALDQAFKDGFEVGYVEGDIDGFDRSVEDREHGRMG